MQTILNADHKTVWREPLWFWGIVPLYLGLIFLVFWDGLSLMIKWWEVREEYSHGFLIPFISLFLIWQNKDKLELQPFHGMITGSFIVLFGLFLFLLGELSSIYTIIQYAFLVTLYGVFLSLMGWQAFKNISIPLLILVFMVPLPNFIYHNLSSELQLISSQIGVWFIRLFGISVFLEGNIIDLGSMKLQVVDACSGLRYLFPLMTLGFIMAYFYKDSLWKRGLIFLSSIPITIIMNSLRIGFIGYTVEFFGQDAAKGFIHDFEGWSVFMASFALLIIEAWLLTKTRGKNNQSFRETFGLDFPEPTPVDALIKTRKLPSAFVVSGIFLIVAALAAVTLPKREEVIPKRTPFERFPLTISEWQGTQSFLETKFIDTLKFNDYLLANYGNINQGRVNFYAAFYDSQRKGASIHSPRSCLPGGGWRIMDFGQRYLKDIEIAGKPLKVNRAIVQLGNNKQLVYYWFQQRGRIITNEYMAKWYLFWDAMTRNRTDGALLRLTTQVKPGQDIENIDHLLADFAAKSAPFLEQYIPN